MSQEQYSESTDVQHVYFPKCIKHDYELQRKILNNLLTEEERKKLRKMVSMKKRRFQNDLFDLDLSYLTDRIIAFGYPSYDYEQNYRNTLESVFQFFEMYHKDKYRLFNLCNELKSYHLVCEGLFDRVIDDFGFLDHHPPPFERIYPFCKAVDQWLSIGDDHVVGVNCKAGKGRTGLMICCYLLWNGACSSAQEAIRIFGQLRTENGVGINLPSQHRYIDYFSQCCAMSKLPKEMQIIEIESIFVTCCLSSTEPIAYLQIAQLSNATMTNALEKKYDSECSTIIEECIIFANLNLTVAGDVKLSFHKSNGKSLAYTWINTNFASQNGNIIHFHKKDIDGPHKDNNHVKYPREFHMKIKYHIKENVVWQCMDKNHLGKSIGIGSWTNNSNTLQEKRILSNCHAV